MLILAVVYEVYNTVSLSCVNCTINQILLPELTHSPGLQNVHSCRPLRGNYHFAKINLGTVRAWAYYWFRLFGGVQVLTVVIFLVMIFCVYETACYQVLKRIVVSEWMQVWRDLHGHGCDCAQTLGCTTQHSGLRAFYRWRATTQWRDFSVWQIQVGMWTSRSHSVQGGSSLFIAVEYGHANVFRTLPSFEFVQSFGTVQDEQRCAHRGMFFLFCWWMGLNCWLKIS